MKLPPLALLPGLNNTRAVFDDVLAALDPSIAAMPLDLPVLDVIGALADHVLATLPERFILCGFSFGGYVALEMLARAPERIAGLVLVGSLPAADSSVARDNRRSAIAAAQAGDYEEFVRAGAAKAFHPDSLLNPQIMAKRSAMIASYGPERFIAHSRAAMGRADHTATLTGFDGPLLMMAGELDPLAPRDKMAELVASDRVVIIPGAGHLVPLEQPRKMGLALTHWIACECRGH